MTTLQKQKAKRQANVLNTSLKYLVVAMASIATIPVTNADVNNKEIGDLEIYQPAEGGTIGLTLMLDTSGSMSEKVMKDGSACEVPTLPDGIINYTGIVGRSDTTPSYETYTCDFGANPTKKVYSAVYIQDWNRYYPCNAKGECNFQATATVGQPTGYNTAIREPYTGLTDRTTGRALTAYRVARNVPLTASEKQLLKKNSEEDRLTRLKNAIFTLMDDKKVLDPNKKIVMGIGQFSSQDTRGQGDGRTGKIIVPAAQLDDAQRLRIKQAVAGLVGHNGTPAAQAYAEVGAYMLGTTTANAGRYSYIQGGRTITADIPSGFANSVGKSGANYLSPIPANPASCDGYGIYFLTDGEPNSSIQPEKLMAKALGRSTFTIPRNTLPDGSQDGHGMPAVGAFAKTLRDATQHNKKVSIRTAVVGFGSVFDTNKYPGIVSTLPKPELDKATSLPIPGKFKDGESDVYFDCTKITGSIDAQNACNWGAKSHPTLQGVGGYGEGGFYSAQETQDVVNSVKTFVDDLTNTIDPVPAGVIVVPNDPYSLSNKQAIAYYPTVEAKVAESASVWPGNMKKYALKDGTLYGKSNLKLFTNLAGDLNPQTQDLWSDKDYSNANNKIQAGGFYVQLKTPTSGLGTNRTLYIQDNGELKTFGVNTSGKVTVNNTQINDTSLTDPIYTEEVKRRLLNFLGFTDIPAGNVADITLTQPDTEVKVLGASIHSSPAVVSHGANLDDNGRVTDARPNDYVLFGSMDGALHLVKAGNHGVNGGGQEAFAFIPQEMLKEQNLEGLSPTGIGKGTGIPNFGIDAPWLVATDYKYDLENKKVTIDKNDGLGMYAYGGLRMGGKAFYGLNLENISSPKLAFAITPESRGFARMGQIWAKPVRAKIKTSSVDAKGTDVLIFGGGYDLCYENEKFQVGVTDNALGACSGKTEAEGNAVYIVNAKTGALIWSASNSSGTVRNQDLKHSIVGEINVLDRNNDGFMDSIYFADLGGQVFRADFKNAGLKVGATETANFTNARIVKLLANADSGDAQKYNRRFYEKPVISVYRNEVNNRLFAMVNVISGDRSSPLSKYRKDNTYADRVYGLMDFDVALPSNTFFADTFSSSFGTGVVDTNLINITEQLKTSSKDAIRQMIENQSKNNTKINGWFYPLTRFDGYANVRYSKGVGRSEVIGSMLYTTVYNPDKDYNAHNDVCKAKVMGGSERQLYCLPYGICTDATSTNGTGGFVPAGRGIQELTLGPLGSTDSTRNKTVLIGNQTITDQAKPENNVGFGADSGKNKQIENTQKQEGNTAISQVGGDGSAAIFLYNERFQLKPKKWYEIN